MYRRLVRDTSAETRNSACRQLWRNYEAHVWLKVLTATLCLWHSNVPLHFDKQPTQPTLHGPPRYVDIVVRLSTKTIAGRLFAAAMNILFTFSYEVPASSMRKLKIVNCLKKWYARKLMRETLFHLTLCSVDIRILSVYTSLNAFSKRLH